MRSMLKTALCISGGGTTAQAVLKAYRQNLLSGIDPYVISSNKSAKGIEKAKALGFKPYIIDRDAFSSIEDFGNSLLKFLKKLKTDLIALQGWIPLITKNIIDYYKGRIINQHPGPLDPGRPDFGGKGMSTPYRVNCARIAYAWMSNEGYWTESVTHYVVEEFDMGDLIRTVKMPFPKKSKKITLEELKNNPQELIEATHRLQKLFYPIEHKNVIATLQLLADGEVSGFKPKKPLIPTQNIQLVLEAKKLATKLFPVYNL